MFCPNCGAKIEGASKFCSKCGGKIIVNTQEGAQAAAVGPRVVVSRKKMSNRTIGIIAAAAVVVVAAIILIIVLSNARTGINLNKYLIVNDIGYDGYGSVNYNIDTWQLRQDYAGKIKLTSEGKSNYYYSMAVGQGEDPIDFIINAVYVHADRTYDLSNGDKVTFSWNTDDVAILETYFHVRLNTNNLDYVVSGLEETTKEDVFVGVSLQYAGTSPNGTATVDIDSGQNHWLNQNNVNLSEYSGLSNGDVITATVTESELYDLVNLYGIEPLETKKEFTVEGLDYYITSLSDLPADALETMKSESAEFIADEIDGWEYTTLNEAKFLGCYLTIPDSGEGNRIYLVYDIVETTATDNESKTYDRYWYNCFQNGIMNADGNFSIDLTDSFHTECSYSRYSGISGEGFTFQLDDITFINSGFETLDGLRGSISGNNSQILDDTVTEDSEN